MSQQKQTKWHALITGALIVVLLAACAFPGARVTTLQGRVDFGTGGRSVQATLTDVGLYATVSIIDPTTAMTVATTVTDASGSFPSFNFSNPKVRTYYLEAIKGLNSSVAGNDAVRVRSLIHWNGTSWQFLNTGTSVTIDLCSTALCGIASLRASASSPVIADNLIGTLAVGVASGSYPDTFTGTYAGTGITQTEFASVSTLVSTSLTNNRDPLSSLLYDGVSVYSLKTTPGIPGPYITGITPNPVFVPATSSTTPATWSTITLSGVNFQPLPSANTLTLSGFNLTVTAASGNQLTATISMAVPTPTIFGTSMGPLQVQTSVGTASYVLSVNPPLNGNVLPPSAPALTSTSNGTSIPGSVFGRFIGLGAY